MGACLLTDTKDNLSCLFEPDHEIITYSTTAEAVSKLKQMIAQPAAAATIAARGQARTLKHHTYSMRMRELVELLIQNRPKKSSSKPHTPRRQTLLVVCRSENLQHIQEKWKQALGNEHQHHDIILICDKIPQNKRINGIRCWCIPNLFIDKAQVEICLNCLKPDQIIIMKRLGEDSTASDWANQFKEQAEAREILCCSLNIQS